MSESDKNAVRDRGYAFHEAGHAILDHLFKNKILRISIALDDGRHGGVTESQEPHPVILRSMGVYFKGTIERHRYYCHRIMTLLAGMISQELFCPESVEPYHDVYDKDGVEQLMRLLDRNASASERDETIVNLTEATRTFLSNPLCAEAVNALALTITQRREISGEDAHATINNAIRQVRGQRRLTEQIRCPHCEQYDE